MWLHIGIGFAVGALTMLALVWGWAVVAVGAQADREKAAYRQGRDQMLAALTAALKGDHKPLSEVGTMTVDGKVLRYDAPAAEVADAFEEAERARIFEEGRQAGLQEMDDEWMRGKPW